LASTSLFVRGEPLPDRVTIVLIDYDNVIVQVICIVSPTSLLIAAKMV